MLRSYCCFVLIVYNTRNSHTHVTGRIYKSLSVSLLNSCISLSLHCLLTLSLFPLSPLPPSPPFLPHSTFSPSPFSLSLSLFLSLSLSLSPSQCSSVSSPTMSEKTERERERERERDGGSEPIKKETEACNLLRDRSVSLR
jgi:hypothetical protein